MADQKILAGYAVRRVRRQAGLTQAAMADALGISPSYLNLLERNQRPLSAALLVRLAEQFDFDARGLAANEPGGGEGALRRRLADPIFADLAIDRAELIEWLAAAPAGVEAFARAYDRMGADDIVAQGPDPAAAVRREIEPLAAILLKPPRSARCTRRDRIGGSPQTAFIDIRCERRGLVVGGRQLPRLPPGQPTVGVCAEMCE